MSVMILNKVGNVSNFSNEGNLNYIRAAIKKKRKERSWRTEKIGNEIKNNGEHNFSINGNISKRGKSQQLL